MCNALWLQSDVYATHLRNIKNWFETLLCFMYLREVGLACSQLSCNVTYVFQALKHAARDTWIKPAVCLHGGQKLEKARYRLVPLQYKSLLLCQLCPIKGFKAVICDIGEARTETLAHCGGSNFKG
jgi:hypothetical protein